MFSKGILEHWSFGSEIFGPKVQRTKGSLPKGLLNGGPESICPGMISGFCSTICLLLDHGLVRGTGQASILALASACIQCDGGESL